MQNEPNINWIEGLTSHTHFCVKLLMYAPHSNHGFHLSSSKTLPPGAGSPKVVFLQKETEPRSNKWVPSRNMQLIVLH